MRQYLECIDLSRVPSLTIIWPDIVVSPTSPAIKRWLPNFDPVVHPNQSTADILCQVIQQCLRDVLPVHNLRF